MTKSFTERGMVIVCVILANIAAVRQSYLVGAIIFSCICVLALFFKLRDLLPTALLFSLLSFYWIATPAILNSLPALPFLLPSLITMGLLLLFKHPGAPMAWFRKGKMDFVSVILLTVTGIASTAALIIWGFWTNNLGIGMNMGKAFLAYPLWIILTFAVPAFALVNAISEELVYRGILQETLNRTISRPFLVVLFQASAFAAVHFASGFPNGVVGYGMVLIYGSMLGYLRLRTCGILAPYIAHVIADLCIGYFLILYLVN